MKKFCRCLLSFPFLASCLCGCSPKSDDLDKTIYHTVTFDTDGGSKIAPIKVKHGDRIPIPKEVPTKARREFDEYRIYSGKLTVDDSFEYKNGEAEEW